ncbi:hypothetical protein BDV12DRAFT_187657 [Aspergillus spectabilis]
MNTQANNSTRDAPPQPRDKADFRIAIICALPLEASAVEALFDEQYETQYSKVAGDSNAYSTGTIGPHNVVLAHMSNIGKVAAATAAACLRATFPGIQLALVVGICGGVPSTKQSKQEILLGDVVISEGLVQYDFGRQYPDNRFLRKDSPRDNLPRPRPEVRSVLAKLQTQPGRARLQNQTSEHLGVLRQKLSTTVVYPGASNDKLFQPWYQHKHQRLSQCDICTQYGACDESIDKNCKELGCSDRERVPRIRQSLPFRPEVHLGLIASGDTVMKSGEVRDEIATRDGVIAFEMEGAGIWEAFPKVLIIKGVCDYADSHKNKRWQAYAAATAASVMKGFLEDWRTGQYLRSRLTWVVADKHLLDTRGETQRSHSVAQNHRASIKKERQNKTLEKLYACPYRDRKDRNPERIAGTCEWFTTHDLFRNWRKSDSARLLWVSADPGCGKSVLGRYLVDSCIPTSKDRTTCYFFFKNDFEDQRTITGALCCILHQLFLQNRKLLSESILEHFETKPTITSSFSELWDILIRATQDKNAGQIVCFLDALDECEEDGRSQLIQAVCKLYTAESDCNIKFLLTSRPYTEIRQKFRSLEQAVPVIHLSGENEEEMRKISREIDIFVEARVKDVGQKMSLRREEQSMLLRKLTRVPNRTYLWVYLTLDFIESSIDIDKAGIAEITSQLPETVNDAYEKILSKSRDVVQTRRLLHIIVAAACPLTLDEMNVASSLKKSDTSCKDLDLKSTERFRTVLRDLCGLFVVIVDSKIYLLHQTAKEFLLRRHKTEAPPNSGTQRWQHSLVLKESDSILAEICMGYLLFADFDTQVDADTKTYVFLEYSAKYWAFHFNSSNLSAETMIESLLKLCDATSKRCQTWWKIYWDWVHDETYRRPASLSIASYFENKHRNIMKFLLGKGANIEARDDDAQTALSWSARKGQVEAISLLLDKGANIESKDRFGQTPLSLAARRGHREAVRFLLERGAKIISKDRSGRTAQDWASQEDHEQVEKLIQEKISGKAIEPLLINLSPLDKLPRLVG